MSEKHKGFQAVRGLGMLLVFLHHSFWLATYMAPGPTETLYRLSLGTIGVFVFFGLSGHLIAGKAGEAPLKFAIDRARRIYPSYWVALLLIGLTLSAYGYDAYASLATFALLPTGNPESIYIGYWTLIFEAGFYLVVLCMMLVSRRHLSLMLALWGVLILAFHPVPPTEASQAAYPDVGDLFLSFYNLYFLVGILGGASLRLKASTGLDSWIAGLLFLAAVATPVAMPEIGGFWHVIVLAVTFFAIRGAEGWRPAAWPVRLLAHLGDLSYGIYLVHIAVCFFAVQAALLLGIQTGYWTTVLLLFVVGGPPSYAFGMLDAVLQRRLKRLLPFRSTSHPVPEPRGSGA